MLDHHPLLRIRSINLHTPKLRLNLPNPLLLLMRRCIAENKIHVLQRLSPRLRDKEIRKPSGQQTERSEEDVRAPVDLGKHVWSD